MATNSTIVGLGEVKASNQPGAIIKVMALGSCIGIVAVAPKQRAVGIAHVVLPDSKIDLEKAESLPGYFADTAIKELLRIFRPFGVVSQRDLVIKIAGGAATIGNNTGMDIGKRNTLAVRKNLWRSQMAPIAEDTGGNFSRTVWVEVDSGRVFVQSPGRGRREL